MAGELPKQTIYIKDLNTTSVTLYPTRAHIVRDINDVLLKPGINEIEIIGLTPAIDEHSVQIDGKGAATIIDMTVDMVPNPDIFEEIYPDDESEEESEEEEEAYEDSDDEPEDVKKIAQEIKDLKFDNAKQTEIMNSANERLASLDRYMRSVSADYTSPDQIKQMMVKYEEERANVFETHSAASKLLAAGNKKLKRKEDEKLKAGKQSRKLKEKQQKRKDKEARSKQLKNAEKRRAAMHIKNERLRYWPKKVFRVLMQLEATFADTPSSSRRASLDSVTLAQATAGSSTKDIEPAKTKMSGSETLVSLSLSYVTKEAAWTPRYDIKISSTTKSAVIVYRTEFINNTSETWKDARVSFSTSQTSYQGLDDAVPQLNPWRVRLVKGGRDTDTGLLSSEERNRSRGAKHVASQFWDRQQFFGKENVYVAPDRKGAFKAHGQNANMPYSNVNSNPFGTHFSRPMQASSNAMPMQQQQQQQVWQQPQQEMQRSSFGGGLFGSSSVTQQTAFASAPAQQPPPPPPGAAPSGGPDFDRFIEGGDFAEAMDFDEPTWEDNGLTTTYDIPHPRTLPPSSQTRRHKIASLNASNINLSHIAIPKLRNAAFLRAKIRNPSGSVTLLKGWAGVTLDGSFLGNMSLPRVSPSQVFDLPLGVDPAIQISYPRPSVMRSSQGIFSKESAQVYTRNIWLTNTKPTPVELTVLDQIPISEEEKLRIDIVAPRGLSKEGDAVKTGASAKEVSGASASGQAGPAKWGSAVATLKKNGQVSYAVKMEKGAACLLKLEYEARLPTSDHIESV